MEQLNIVETISWSTEFPQEIPKALNPTLSVRSHHWNVDEEGGGKGLSHAAAKKSPFIASMDSFTIKITVVFINHHYNYFTIIKTPSA